jgi:antitoxin MazE
MTTTSIIQWGDSQGIRLPKFLMDSVNITENDTVEVTAQDNSIIIKKVAKKRKTIQERFENFEGSYETAEIDWGKPVGKEVW